ncbi:MAG TPA: hypothetical protein VMC85_14685 [Desulfomonilaceae bacterium]|nr:hypothetical protein [Desulfomonilaceae bacterium]
MRIAIGMGMTRMMRFSLVTTSHTGLDHFWGLGYWQPLREVREIVITFIVGT